jgi:HD-like signal output (HDOD) protein
MHDIGKLLILQRSGSDYQKVVEHAARTGVSFCAAEEELLFFNHTEVGQLIAEKWNFTTELAEMIRDHHHSWDLLLGRGTISSAAIVKAADTIAHATGLGHGKDLARFRKRAEEELDACWEALSFPTSERKDFLSRCTKTFDSEFDLYSGKGI